MKNPGVKKGDKVRFLKGQHKGEIHKVLESREITEDDVYFFMPEWGIKINCCKAQNPNFLYSFSSDWFEVIK